VLSTFSSTVDLALTQIQLMQHLRQCLRQHLRQHLMQHFPSDAETRPEFGPGSGKFAAIFVTNICNTKKCSRKFKKEKLEEGKMFFCHEGNGFSGFVSTVFRLQESKKGKREAALAASLFLNVLNSQPRSLGGRLSSCCYSCCFSCCYSEPLAPGLVIAKGSSNLFNSSTEREVLRWATSRIVSPD